MTISCVWCLNISWDVLCLTVKYSRDSHQMNLFQDWCSSSLYLREHWSGSRDIDVYLLTMLNGWFQFRWEFKLPFIKLYSAKSVVMSVETSSCEIIFYFCMVHWKKSRLHGRDMLFVGILSKITTIYQEWAVSVFCLWLSKVLANESRRYLRNVFSHWLRPYSTIDRKRTLYIHVVYDTAIVTFLY